MECQINPGHQFHKRQPSWLWDLSHVAQRRFVLHTLPWMLGQSSHSSPPPRPASSISWNPGTAAEVRKACHVLAFAVQGVVMNLTLSCLPACSSLLMPFIAVPGSTKFLGSSRKSGPPACTSSPAFILRAALILKNPAVCAFSRCSLPSRPGPLTALGSLNTVQCSLHPAALNALGI